MQVAVLLYPGFTSLDAIGPYEVLGRLPDTEVVLVAERPGEVTNDLGSLTVRADRGLDDVPAPDVVLVPGGPGQSDQMGDGPTHRWLRAVDATSTWTTSVCTGSLILAGAGLLTGRRATSHWRALDQLALHGAVPVKERVVVDGHYASAAGVSSGIDMALTLAGRIVGTVEAQTVQLVIEYAPDPPFRAGSPDTAPPEVLARAQHRLARRFADERPSVRGLPEPS